MASSQVQPHAAGTLLIDRFRVLKTLGKGSFGVVYQVADEETKQIYALKTFKRKFTSWEAAMRNAEVKAMIGLKHPNIVTCLEVIRHDDTLYMVFELLDMDLYRMMQMRKLNDDPFSHEEIRHIIQQIASALDYIHCHGFFHRDVKPENVLIQKKTTVKLGDFGLVKEIRHPTPFTEYVSTRWYRAPENVLGSRSYNYPVDIFALGCIMAELYTFKPLFPGSSEMDQFQKISMILGKPDPNDWPDARRLADRKLFTMPEHGKINLQTVVPRASPEAIRLMEWMLSYNPKKRPKPSQVMQHEFFHPRTSVSNNQISPKTPNPRSSQDTTADSKSRVESIIIGQNNLQILSKLVQSNRSISNLQSDKATQQAVLAAKLQGQAIEKRKSIDSNNLDASPAPINRKQQNQRQPSRKLEPLIEAKSSKMVPKPSVSPDLAMAAEGQSIANMVSNSKNANTKVSPFGGQEGLAASHSIQVSGKPGGGGRTLDLGPHPVNARNINVQSVMAESSNMIEVAPQASNGSKLVQSNGGGGAPNGGAVNLRKTFNNNQSSTIQQNGPGAGVNNSHQNQLNHFATINGDTSTTNGNNSKPSHNLNQSVIVSNDRSNNGHQLKGKQPNGGNVLNDSVVIMGGGGNSHKKSIQSIVNQAFEDGVVIANNNDSQLSQKAGANNFQATPKQSQMSVVNRQNYLSKTNNQHKHVTKSPQPLKLSGNMANEIDLTRASPSQISQMVQQREMRNNSTMAITNNQVINVTGSGAQSVMSQSNAMGVTKRHLQDGPGSTKWLPQVGTDKKSRPTNQQNTTTIQIGKGEIQVTNQAQSPGPSSIKMYQTGGMQQQPHHLRVTNQIGNAGAQISNQHYIQEQHRASMQLNQTSRQQKMMQAGNQKGNSKRAAAANQSELSYKIQLPEIMQQQQTKINQMKKQHEIRFSSKRPLQLTNQAVSMTQTRTKSFYDSQTNTNHHGSINAPGGHSKNQSFSTMGQSLSLTNQNQAHQNGPPQPKKAAQQYHQKQFMQTMQNITEEARMPAPSSNFEGNNSKQRNV